MCGDNDAPKQTHKWITLKDAEPMFKPYDGLSHSIYHTKTHTHTNPVKLDSNSQSQRSQKKDSSRKRWSNIFTP